MTETTTVELTDNVVLEVRSTPTPELIQLLSEVGAATDDPSTVREEMLDAFELLIEADKSSVEVENASYCDREVWEQIAEYNDDDHLWWLLEAVATPVLEMCLNDQAASQNTGGP